MHQSRSCASSGLALQAFPLSVKLHLTNLNLILTFSYLPALNTVTAEANHKAGNELLASLFKDDTGQETPRTASQSTGDGAFVFDTKATARPYRSAQHCHCQAEHQLAMHWNSCVEVDALQANLL